MKDLLRDVQLRNDNQHKKWNSKLASIVKINHLSSGLENEAVTMKMILDSNEIRDMGFHDIDAMHYQGLLKYQSSRHNRSQISTVLRIEAEFKNNS
jgi:hypothetical protein